MSINYFVLAINPFLDAYTQSDWLGKIIFISLLLISVVTWTLMVYKWRATHQAKDQAHQFQKNFKSKKSHPLTVDENSGLHPFSEVYQALKGYTLDILGKNQRFGSRREGVSAHLSSDDIEFIEAHTAMTITGQTQKLESHLYILATIVTLAPFLGLLGTVWGILSTFSEMQTMAAGNTNQAVLGGLSLALATTVLGLIDAIPALIGYNYLKNRTREFQTEMEAFANEVLAAVELQYRRVEISGKEGECAEE